MPGEISELPDDPTAFHAQRPVSSDGRRLRPRDPIAREGARLVELCAKLGRRLSYALSVRWLGPERVACPTCTGMTPGRLPDEHTVATFKEYAAATTKLLGEQRERVSLIYRYKIRPDLTEGELKEKVRAIFIDVLDTMDDDELAEALERRRVVRAASPVLDVGVAP